MIVLSGIFFALEIKGAVYMRDTINEIMESDQKGTEKFQSIGSLFL